MRNWIVNVSYRLAAPRIFTLSKLYPARACDFYKNPSHRNPCRTRVLCFILQKI
jgi:hypothetical protein